MSFQAYLLATAEKERAYANYCHAGAALELAKIKERLAEVQSQHEPLHSLSTRTAPQGHTLTERERLYAAAFYVVIGRMP